MTCTSTQNSHFLVAHIAVIRYTQVPKKNTPHTMRDKEHRYDTRRRQIFLFPPLILRSETEQEKKHRATMQNWRHLEGGEASVKRYLMTDADKERSPKDESQRFSKWRLPVAFGYLVHDCRYATLGTRCHPLSPQNQFCGDPDGKESR